jgi:hypothetical protein
MFEMPVRLFRRIHGSIRSAAPTEWCAIPTGSLRETRAGAANPGLAARAPSPAPGLQSFAAAELSVQARSPIRDFRPEEGLIMSTDAMAEYTLVLTDDERKTLVDILEELLKETMIELRRTESFGAQEVVRTKEMKIQSLLRKAREAGLAKG